MRKIIMFLITITLFFVIYPENTKLYCSVLEANDLYSISELLLILTEKESKKWIEYNTDSFSEIEYVDIEDLTITYNQNEELKIVDNIDGFKRILKLTLKYEGKENLSKAINLLNKRPEIFYVGPNYCVNNLYDDVDNSVFSRNSNFEQWGYDTIQLDQSLGIIRQYDASEVLVGVIDCGVDEHIDLTNSIDILISKSFSDDNDDPLIDSLNGHGTMIAGIIAGKPYGDFGFYGICPTAEIASIKYTSYSFNYVDDIIKCITHATLNNIRILNMSFCIDYYDESLKTSIDNYPGLAVCGVGNSGKNIGIETNMVYPACYDLDNIITVGSLDVDLLPYSGANYGINEVDIFAPGVQIVSTSTNNSYSCQTANSFAVPFVTGVAAQVVSIEQYTIYNFFDTIYLKNLIIDSATQTSSLANQCVSGGYLNAYQTILNAFSSQFSYEAAGYTYHKVIPKYSFDYLEEHEWNLLSRNYYVYSPYAIPIIGRQCVKCGVSII